MVEGVQDLNQGGWYREHSLVPAGNGAFCNKYKRGKRAGKEAFFYIMQTSIGGVEEDEEYAL